MLEMRELLFEFSVLPFELLSLTGQIRPFDRRGDLDFAELSFPLRLQRLQSLAFFDDQFIVVDQSSDGHRANRRLVGVWLAPLLEEVPKFGDFVVSLTEVLRQTLDHLLEPLHLFRREFRPLA